MNELTQNSHISILFQVNSYKDIFARFRFHDTFIICGTESFKGRLNENINLPPTILEDTVGTEQGHIPPHERRTTRGRYNANRVNDRKNVNRRPLRTSKDVILTQLNIILTHFKSKLSK